MPELLLQRRGPRPHAGESTEGIHHLVDQCRVVPGRERMGFQHMRHIGTQGLHRVSAVLVQVHDKVRGRKPADLFDIDRFGAAHLGDAANGLFGMNAIAGPADKPIHQAQVDQQFGQAGHKADDARRAFSHHTGPQRGKSRMFLWNSA